MKDLRAQRKLPPLQYHAVLTQPAKSAHQFMSRNKPAVLPYASSVPCPHPSSSARACSVPAILPCVVSTNSHSSICLALLLLLDLQQQRAVDVRQYATEGDSGADQSVEFFVTTDGELQMARSDTLDLEILGSVACQFENFGGEILQDSSDIDRSFGSDAHLILCVVLQETLDTTAGELDRDHRQHVTRNDALLAVFRTLRVSLKLRELYSESDMADVLSGSSRAIRLSDANRPT